MRITLFWMNPMRFSSGLIQFRKAQNLTQQGLADAAQIHVNQIKRHEAGTAQPTLEALVRLAKVLHFSLDELVFSKDERARRITCDCSSRRLACLTNRKKKLPVPY